MRYQALLVVALVLALVPIHRAAELVENVSVANDETVELDVFESEFTDATEDSWMTEADNADTLEEEEDDLHAQGRSTLQTKKKSPPPAKKKRPPPPAKKKRPPPPRKRPPPPRRSPPPPRPQKSPPPPPNSPPPASPPPVVRPSPPLTPFLPSPPPPTVGPARPDNFCSFPTTQKVISGRRIKSTLSGIRPCFGPRVANPGECCAQCQADPTCIAWTFTKPMDCRGQGIPDVASTGACYLIDTTTGEYDPIQNFQYISGKAFT